MHLLVMLRGHQCIRDRKGLLRRCDGEKRRGIGEIDNDIWKQAVNVATGGVQTITEWGMFFCRGECLQSNSKAG